MRVYSLPLSRSVLWALSTSRLLASAFNFAVIPKAVSDPYHMDVQAGCVDKAAEIMDATVKCIFRGPDTYEDYIIEPDIQVRIINELVDEGEVDGISIAVQYVNDALEEAIENAVDNGIPVITYDSDAPTTKRSTYIGTDNFKFGDELGKVLLQIAPEGGEYAIISGLPGQANLDARVAGMEDRLSRWRSKWKPAQNHISDSKNDVSVALQDMWDFVETNPNIKAILSCCGWAMYDSPEWKRFVRANRNVTLINGDSNAAQLVLLNQGYGDGLVGQLPYEMGTASIEKLLQLKKGKNVGEEILGTTLLQHLRVPLILPDIDVDWNFIGNLRIFGYVLFGIVSMSSIGCAIWVFISREHQVVKASQPLFLMPLCFGVLVLGSAIVPMTFDDNLGLLTASKACMAVPWLTCVGFTLTFSMLFSKTWRIKQIVQQSESCRRVHIKEKDVLWPFIIIMVANVIVLACWTAFAPLTFVRRYHSGTDDWNRILSTYGTCQTSRGSSTPFVFLLLFINTGVLIIANFQAFQARHITTDFSESKYIGLAVAFILQAVIICMPVAFMSRDNPRVLFMICTILVGVSCMATLSFIFIPKMKAKCDFDECIDQRGSTSLMASRRNIMKTMQSQRRNSLKSSIDSVEAIKERVANSKRLLSSVSASVNDDFESNK